MGLPDSVANDSLEIAPEAVLALIEASTAMGFDRATVLSRAGLSEATLGGDRAHWDMILRLLDGLRGLGMAELDFEAMGAATIMVPSWLRFRHLASMAMGPEQLYRLACHWIGPTLLAPLSFSFEKLGNGRVLLGVRVPPQSAALHPRAATDHGHLIIGSVRAMPSLINLPPAHTRGESRPTGATVTVEFEETSRLHNLKRAVRQLAIPSAALDELMDQQRALRERNQELVASRRNLDQILDKIPDAVVVVQDQSIVYANPAFAFIVGANSAAALIGTELRSWFVPDAAATLALHFAPEPNTGRRMREFRVAGRQEAVTLEFGPAELVEFDNTECALAIARDVSGRKHIEDHLVRTDRMLSLGRMAAGVAHELNNPLAYVTMNVSLIERAIDRLPAGKNRDSLQTAINAVRHGVGRATTIVKDLSTFARPQPETTEGVPIGEVLNAAISMTRKQTEARATVMIRLDGPTRVRANRARLEQVFVNLILNASGSFEVDDPVANRIELSTLNSDDEVAIRVSDNGQGIPPHAREQIFDPFFTTKSVRDGSGLELSICHGIITRFGGDIEVETEVGRGTTFIVTLPLDDSNAKVIPTVPLPRSHQRPARSRILLIDDEPALAAVMKDLLAETHEVMVANSGKDALDLLARDDRFDCVLCDLMLEEVSGIDVYELLQRRDSHLVPRIVFMTGGAFTDASRDFLARIDNPCLEKPFSMDRLLGMIADVTGTPTSPPSPLDK